MAGDGGGRKARVKFTVLIWEATTCGHLNPNLLPPRFISLFNRELEKAGGPGGGRQKKTFHPWFTQMAESRLQEFNLGLPYGYRGSCAWISFHWFPTAASYTGNGAAGI